MQPHLHDVTKVVLFFTLRLMLSLCLDKAFFLKKILLVFTGIILFFKMEVKKASVTKKKIN